VLDYPVGGGFVLHSKENGGSDLFNHEISRFLNDGINQIALSGKHWANGYRIKVENIQISAVRKDGGNTNIGYSDRLNNNGTIALAIENEISLSNLGDVQMSYFNQAIENISYLRAQTSATKSRLKFTSDLEYENKSLTNKAYGRIADVDYALERSYLTKQKIMTSASAAMIVQANTMGDVVLAMLNKS
jgi:flagellin